MHSGSSAYCLSMTALIVSTRAFSLIGSTIPVVPRIEIPPSIPNRGLNVFLAISSPPGTDISTSIPRFAPYFSKIRRQFSRIIFLGTGLIAGSPTAHCKPLAVTTPTPFPPMIPTAPSWSPNRTSAKISAPWVTSGSSPPSLVTEQRTRSLPISIFCRENSAFSPPGKETATVSVFFCDSSISAAAVAAAAAQLPVV